MEVGLQRERRLCALIRTGMGWGINHADNNEPVSVLVHQGPSETQFVMLTCVLIYDGMPPTKSMFAVSNTCILFFFACAYRLGLFSFFLLFADPVWYTVK